MEKIELTKEQFEVIECGICMEQGNSDCFGHGLCSNVEARIELAKKAGFIKQSPVEKAEEIIKRYSYGVDTEGFYDLSCQEINDLFDAIVCLKKQLGETK